MSNAIQRAENDEWKLMFNQARALVSSGFLPKAINTPEKAVAVIQTGRELGLGPMQSLRGIHIIEGKPTLSADLMAGLALQRCPDGILRVVESTDAVCVVEAGRTSDKLTEYRFTMEDANRAGVSRKDNWKKWPRAMLRARALTEAARATFPDSCMGLYDPDELGATTNDEGQVIDVQPASSGHRALPESEEDNVTKYIEQLVTFKTKDEVDMLVEHLKSQSLSLSDKTELWDAIQGKLADIKSGKTTIEVASD